MTHRRPSVVDLRWLDGEPLALALRELGEAARDASYRLVLDLGLRRVVPRQVVDALVAAHREITAAGGRCAVVVGPAIAAQVAAAYPEGVLWAADAEAGVLGLGGGDLDVTADWDRLSGALRLAGVVDLRGAGAIEPALRELRSAVDDEVELVIDLSQVTFADVAGLRAVVFAAQAAGAGIEWQNASGQVRRLVDRLGWQAELSSSAGDRSGQPGATALREAIRRELAGRGAADQWAVIATDLVGRVTHWSRAAERLYGWRRSEALGRAITELTVGPEDQQLAREIMQTVRAAGAWEGEFEVRRRDGSTLIVQVRDSVIRDAHGRAVGLLGVSAMAPPRSRPVLKAA